MPAVVHRSMLWSVLAAAAAALGTAAWMARPARAQQTYTASLVCAAPSTSVWGDVLRTFKADVAQRTNNKVTINLVFGASPGAEDALVQQVIAGTTHQAGAFTTAALAQAASAPRVAVAELPYLFLSPAEVNHILDTVIKDDVSGDLKAKGLTFSGWADNGWLHFATKTTTLQTPAHFAGVSLRSQPSLVHQNLQGALGATAVPLSLDQVGAKLADGSVEGLETSLAYMQVAGPTWAPLQKVSETQHVYQPAAVVWTNSFWDTLPPDFQTKINLASATLTANSRNLVRAQEAAARTALQGNGVAIVTLTPAQRVALKQQTLSTHTAFSQISPQAAALLNEVNAALQQLRGGN